MKIMACVNKCPDSIVSWKTTPQQCHGVEKKYYKHVYAVCKNGQNLYCRTEWGGNCSL
ncbi:laterosporulin family class IId bacteriocin [Brevibacillus laterosporus]|uniref:laterosporulin family class IId bacteriocin n=2 Tax=Brevibacillus laterosporus TaxID=1465 RepID=UPI003D1A296C